MTTFKFPCLLAASALCIPLEAVAADAAAPACGALSPPKVNCSCDVRALRPLQGALGMEEVRAKAEKIAGKPDKEARKLEADPIKVVIGPGGGLYITDHHHGADAWRLVGRPMALCRVLPRPPYSTGAQFWDGLKADSLVRLADANGAPITPGQLPKSLQAMPDDPYRSLAWRLKQAGGFCRSKMAHKEFAEFLWADWLRGRLRLSAALGSSTAAALPSAVALARSPAARSVPGFVGDEPPDYTCADDD